MAFEERNQNNATHSTGPRTEQGKAISSQNALKHGLSLQRHVILPGEDPAAYQLLRQELQAIYNPQSERESLAVEDLAQCRWAIQRVDQAELHLLAQAPPDDPFPDKLFLLQRYRGHWERRNGRALREFRQAAQERQRETRERIFAAQAEQKLRILVAAADTAEMELENRRYQHREAMVRRIEDDLFVRKYDPEKRKRLWRYRREIDKELGFVSPGWTMVMRVATEEQRRQWAEEAAKAAEEAPKEAA